MDLLQQLAETFTDETREQGAELLARAAVSIRKATAQRIRAIVTGAPTQSVILEWDSAELDFTCTCHQFTEHGQACPHIWAVILHAKEQSILPDLAEIRPDADGGPNGNGNAEPQRSSPPRLPAWKQAIGRARQAIAARLSDESPVGPAIPADRRIVYVIDVPATLASENSMIVEVATQDFSGEEPASSPLRPLRLAPSRLNDLPDDLDRQILQMLAGYERADVGHARPTSPELPRRYALSDSAFVPALKLLCSTGRCLLRRERDDHEPKAIAFEDTDPWTFVVRLDETIDADTYTLCGILRRDELSVPVEEIDLILGGRTSAPGVVVHKGRVSRMEHFGAYDLLWQLRVSGAINVPRAQVDELVDELYTLPRMPRLELPESMHLTEIRSLPRPRLNIRHDADRADSKLAAELSFDYGDVTVPAHRESVAVLSADRKKAIVRDPISEGAAIQLLNRLGFRADYDEAETRPAYLIPSAKLPRVVMQLVGQNWIIEAEGKLYRRATDMKFAVASGIDWFGLRGNAMFGDISVPLPRLLQAVRSGEAMIRLDDGTFGILPDEWLKKYSQLALVGEEHEDEIRFTEAQVGFLDALLSALPQADWDEKFAQARDRLESFQHVQPADPATQFVGTLRPYQREGLGWVHFLRELHFGGCLADDMGLGKTVQVLALLQARKQPGRTSLVVVPRSLVFNWKSESTRFTPDLRILDHTGPTREKSTGHFAEYDLIITTYGTLRLDAAFLRNFDFDYVILDEAQAIKNAATESAKAARLLRASHRLALSGTPIENHLGELWSIFEFLNPGLLGSSTMLNSASSPAAQVEPETRTMLSRALRPFILRRTKEQVARELPEKLQQTIICDLEPDQRRLYDELREHYRAALLDRVAREGLAKSKIQILEALLRLRQAACHPGLINPAHLEVSSAKLDELVPRLVEAADEGHKVLVFSQFTSFLSIVRSRLENEKLVYEYLDGKTRDRKQRVDRFQLDDACKVFLISLRAGGLGLNLTAADYVFLLDPWWNPAVEAQAIDRAHRIGQTKPVFAYRLIARDTVEEKVLSLQESKRDLADAIITADNSTLRNLQKEDLEMLLS